MFSIRNRLIIIFGGTAILVLAVVLFFGSKNIALFETLRESEIKALFLKNIAGINSLVEKFELSAKTIGVGASMLRSFKAKLPEQDLEPDVKQFLLGVYQSLNESVGGGFWFEPKAFDPNLTWYGPYIYRSGNTLSLTWDYNTAEYNYHKQEWYLTALPENWDRNKKRGNEIYWTPPYFDAVSKITMVTVDAFIYDQAGKILGVTTVDWALDSVLKQLEASHITPGMESFVVDMASGKVVLYTPDESMKLKQKTKIEWLQELATPSKEVSTVITWLDDVAYRVYYAKMHNDYMYGVMIPEAEFMPDILAILHYGEIALIVVFILMLAVLSFIYRSIATPIDQISETVQRLDNGDYSARTNLFGTDELSRLGQAIDHMLEERVKSLVNTEQDKENLSNSVIKLLEAVSQLSQRDLTIKIPVTEDVTGPVADAINLLTEETAKVLREVTNISESVVEASKTVKDQSDAVIVMAETEREVVNKTASELSKAAEDMQRMAQLAQVCNSTAEAAMESTQSALNIVTSTVEGINSTRDTIKETEKRIKRLGERSQDITGVVNLINTIAERTHILALNASMHAASAGQAGRGFAVVANEVQRLAENAREATSRISTLVSNIQIETVDTANAINAAINQVIDGSRLAELAGEQMKHTQETTADLVNGVRQIAESSQEQANTNVELLNRAKQIQAGTQQTSQQLQEQIVHTNRLASFAQDLVNSVRVFRLPA